MPDVDVLTVATRTLTLRREALTELTPGDLAEVHGASGVTCLTPAIRDVTELHSQYNCPTFNC